MPLRVSGCRQTDIVAAWSEGREARLIVITEVQSSGLEGEGQWLIGCLLGQEYPEWPVIQGVIKASFSQSSGGT